MSQTVELTPFFQYFHSISRFSPLLNESNCGTTVKLPVIIWWFSFSPLLNESNCGTSHDGECG